MASNSLLASTKELARRAGSEAAFVVRRRAVSAVRVLVYHRVEPAPLADDPWSVSQREFSAQLDVIKNLGFVPVRLADLQHWPLRRPRRREILIAFDDGYRSVLEHAAPLLRAHGYPAACFVVAGAVGATSTWEVSVGQAARALMDFTELRELSAIGFDIGAHGLTHRDLSLLDQADLEAEIKGARATLEEGLGQYVTALSVPFSRDDPRIDPIMRCAGYELKVTDQLATLGTNRGLTTVPSTIVVQGDSERTFTKKLVGAYDWLLPYWRMRRGPAPRGAARPGEASSRRSPRSSSRRS